MPSSPTDRPKVIDGPPTIEHATCVTVDGRGLLIAGPSGSGKSDLALRLIQGGARLVADDRPELILSGEAVVASAPAAIRGLLEVRGLGIVRLAEEECADRAEIAAVIDLVAEPGRVTRMPYPSARLILGRSVPELALFPFEPSAVARVRMFLRTIDNPEMLIE